VGGPLAGGFSRPYIFVDIDVDFDTFEKHHREFFERHVEWVLSRSGYRARHIHIERSTNNHVHAYILLDRPVTDPEEYLHLMAAMWADPGLCSISYFRLKAFGDPMVKSFFLKRRPRRDK